MPSRGQRVGFLVAAALVAGGALLAPRVARAPAETDAKAELERLEGFAAATRRHAFEASWQALADPAARVGPPSGSLPLTWLREDDVRELAAELADPEDLLAAEWVGLEAAAVRAGRDPELQRAVQALTAARRERASTPEQDVIERALLEAATPQERQAAWMRLHADDPALAPLVIEVASARNAWAARESGEDYATWSARTAGSHAELVERLRAQATEALRPADGAPLADPWDAEAADPALAARMARALDADGSLRRATSALAIAGVPEGAPGLRIVEGGGGGGFSAYATFPVDPPRDVRVLLPRGAGIPAHWSGLHEMGHAAQALLVAPERRPSRRWPGPGVGEACAKVVERLAYAPEWLALQGVPESDVAALLRWESASELARGRDILADVAFEDALHADPDGDLDAAWARARRELAGESTPLPEAWAAERSAALEPGRRIEYLLSRCAQAAIYRRLRALPGGLLGDEARRVLREDVLGAAAGASYGDWFERAAGVPPACDAWLEDVVGAGGARGARR